ncbi:MAG: CopG family antitoxin [Spirochaetia bacterium]|nr:CopG family antitoxin [Spirochaetia bacterium]
MAKNNITNEDIKEYKKKGNYWDSHSSAEILDRSKEVKCEIDIKSETFNITLDIKLSKKLNELEKKKGISSNKIIKNWLEEKIAIG